VPPCTGLHTGLCTALNRPVFRALHRCAGGSYPSHPTSPVQSTAWERGSQRKRAAASWHWSRIGIGLLCAPKGIAESFIFRMVSARPRVARTRLLAQGGLCRPIRVGWRVCKPWNPSSCAHGMCLLRAAAAAACDLELRRPSGACVPYHLHLVRSDRGYSRHRCYRLPWAGPRWLLGSWQPSHSLCKVRLHRLDHARPFVCDRSPPE
jgi:hypothetical protein